jgi:sugar O-acyltransferase (sialic acid O-acetyltransferase NeuD family)
MKYDLILLGGGGHCKSCIDVIEHNGKFRIKGILDVDEKIGEKILGYDIIGSDKDLLKLVRTVKFFLVTHGQIYSPDKRIQLYSLVKSINAKLPIIISPLAYVAKSANIGEGTIIMRHALVTASSLIGIKCIINTKALVEHDAIVGDHCHIATSAILNGEVRVGNGSFIGSGSVIKQTLIIPENSFVKAQSLVKK